jgi:hypothetical protein
VRCVARPNSPGKDYLKKSKDALSKLQAIKGNFRRREKRITADLEKARKIWKKVGERFSWWQSLP